MNNWNPQTASAYVNYRKDVLSTHQVTHHGKKETSEKTTGKRKIRLFR